MFSYDRMVEWSAAAGNLAQDGGARAASYLERATRRRPEAFAAKGGRLRSPESSDAEAQAFRFATVVFSIALLVTMTGERAVLGVNLFTAEILVGLAALGLFLNTLRRCV
jgi:hypothetical protein